MTLHPMPGIPAMQATRYLKLPLQFDIDRLVQELDHVLAPEWIDHFNTAAHDSRWSCIPLRSVAGRTDHIMPVPDAEFMDTAILRRCPYFQQVLDSFQCKTTSVRLMALEAGGIIHEHTDKGTCFEDGIARLHIPIVTDAAVIFTIDDEPIHFSRGDTWYMNASCRHSVHNRSTLPRIHLLLDCIPNPWLEQLFYATGFIPNPKPKYDDPAIHDGNVLEIIERLRQSGNTAANDIADKLSAIHTAPD
jgi:quercetin dioxygenase-like cupin family protein